VTATAGKRRGSAAGGLVAALVIAGAAIATLSSNPASSSARFAGNGFPNVDQSNRRELAGQIDSGSVSRLEEAWAHPFTGQSAYGSFASTPVISDGVVYLQDLASNVEAIDLQTGKLLWRKEYDAKDEGPNGVTVAGGRVYGATPTNAFALEQSSGRQIWSTALTHSATAGIDMAPGYHQGIVYVSTVPVTATGQYLGPNVGVLWALDARTGRKLWTFDTIASSVAGGARRTGAGRGGDGGGGGGLWYTPAFDTSGSMYFGVGNPTPFPGTKNAPWGSSRPGPNRFSDSIVKLNARTGALDWYYQLTPHDLYDWDLQDPPILVDSAGRQLALAAGKGGIVIALDASTGKPVWTRAVGIHNGHDHDGLYAMKGEYSRLKTPATIFPGVLGGVIAPMSTNGSKLFVPVINHSAELVSPFDLTEDSASTGELVALAVQTGAIAWRRRLSGAPLGATTVVNDLVFATTFNGELLAFDTANGQEVWRETLPDGTNAGVMASGSTLLAAAGVPIKRGEPPRLVAYRLASAP
jgi:glucose dehydrogenase